MGDRCYMQITCRKEDKEPFEQLGFVEEIGEDPSSPLIQMIDEEANYAHVDELPTDIPYYGFSGPGGSYGSSAYACDGEAFVEVPVGQEGGYVVLWDEKKNRPTKESLKRIRQYLAVTKHTQAILAALVKPSTDQKP